MLINFKISIVISLTINKSMNYPVTLEKGYGK